ncbi:MAG: nuclear transport factor 2 family protein [Acidimicrobiia bacterium]
MTETDLVDLQSTVDRHLAGYCETDPARRRELLDGAWHPTGTLVDPPFDATGPAEIAALVDAVLGHYPDHRFRRTSTIDAHHDHARYGWELVGPDGAVAVTGTDFLTLDDAGRITGIVGFFGDPTPAG